MPSEQQKWKWHEFGQEKVKQNKLDRERQQKQQQTENCIKCGKPTTPIEYVEGRGFCTQCRLLIEQSETENSKATKNKQSIEK